ncbi:MAG TPA: 4'-phosphopantetheinyl transferase superfamily protein [Pirellulales bacterium]|jgi:4'-phosphopantetheinyl transferase|nr:4'-phosphopantetheinyl transferase superfamily protein [Pirellulales bacterium]
MPDLSSAADAPEWEQLEAAVHAWCLDAGHPAAGILCRRSSDWIDPAELEQLDRFGWSGHRLSGGELPVIQSSRTEQLRQTRLTARALVRVVLSHHAGIHPASWRLVFGTHGKPAIAAPAGLESLHFNLTHTEGLLICAVSRAGDIGVDAEVNSRPVDIEQVARHFFSSREQQRLAELPPAVRTNGFFEQWVLKEAYLKGLGSGLTQSPESFTVERDGDGRPIGHDNWQLSLARPTPRHIAAIAVRPQRPEPIRIVWREASGLVGQADEC